MIEKLATAKSIFFDKTGTITDGKIQVASIEPVSELTEVELLEIAYTLEKSSGHVGQSNQQICPRT